MEASPGSDAGRERRVSEAVRASLAAVRAAQQAARERRRRESLRARALAATALFTFVAGIAILGHFQGWHWRRAAAAGRASSPPVGVLAPAAMAASLDGASEVASSEPEPEAATGPTDDALGTCSDAVALRHLRTAAAACAEAFAAQPSDAKLAMRVAKVQHARGQYQEAGEWASKAIALQTTDADAFIILAHAETRARHPAAARAAYRKYLDLAPRGWHASEARRFVKNHRKVPLSAAASRLTERSSGAS